LLALYVAGFASTSTGHYAVFYHLLNDGKGLFALDKTTPNQTSKDRCVIL
jgi:hypothetical protein